MPNPSTDKNGQKPSNKKVRRNSNEILKYSGMAFEMFAIMGLFVYAGVKLDEKFQTEKSWFMILGAIIGVVAAMVYTLRDFISNKK